MHTGDYGLDAITVLSGAIYKKMALLLGIDTGGTYTDAVLYDEEQGVLASAKVLTTKHDLAIGIGQAFEKVMQSNHEGISLVSLT